MKQELTHKRTRFSKTFNLGGGAHLLETGNHSHVFRSGSWVDTDTQFVMEKGTDSETGLSYTARSKPDFSDYDVKLGKDNPMWMRVSHVPSRKTIVFRPLQCNLKPDTVVIGNTVYATQVWDGIDVKITLSDAGTKADYTITSSAGQRQIKFAVNGFDPIFKLSPAWYKTAEGLLVLVPMTFDGSTLIYDFTKVPVGTVIDPSITANSVNGREARATAGTWSGARDATIANAYVVNNTECSITNVSKAGSSYGCSRTYCSFDTSAIGSGTVTSGSINWRVTLPVRGYVTHCFYVGSDPMIADNFGGILFTEITERRLVSSLSTAFNSWAFTTPGLVGINTTGNTLITSLGASLDFENVAPTSADQEWCNAYAVGNATPSLRPYLSLTYTEVNAGPLFYTYILG